MYANTGLNETPGAWPPGPGLLPQGGLPPRRGRNRGKVVAVIVTCAVAAGGAFAVTEALSGPGQAANQGTAAAAASGPTGQAAVLNTALADAASATTGTPAGNGAAVRRLGRALVRLRLLGGMYGQYTFETKNGPRTLAFERGTVLSVAGADVTVKATDGTTWTWVLTSTSVVREDGSRTSAKSLAAGQLVLAAGPVSGTTRDARLVVIRTAAKKQQA